MDDTGSPVEDIQAVYDDLESDMLADFFKYVETHQNYTWMHWNMRDINYGFSAIEHRFKVLGGEPVHIHESKKLDLARSLTEIYGVRYITHSRLENLVKKNRISDSDFLAGAKEAVAFENGEYVKLHQSTLRKVDVIANIAERVVARKLKTEAKWLERHGPYPIAAVEYAKEHWLVSMLTLIALGYTIFQFVMKLLQVETSQ